MNDLDLPRHDLTRQLLDRTLARETLPMPFQGREIELLVTYIAGMVHHNRGEEIQALPAEGELHLQREPGNPHDGRAIAVHWRERRIGYVPRRENTALAALMDAGKLLSARLLPSVPKCPAWMVKKAGYDREIRICLVDL